MAKKTGRPEAQIEKKRLENLMRLRPSLEEAAYQLAVSVSTLQRFIRKTYGVSFDQFRDQKGGETKLKLVETAIKMAIEKGNVTMLIFCLKNVAGWKDNPTPAAETQDQSFKLNYSKQEIRDEVLRREEIKKHEQENGQVKERHKEETTKEKEVILNGGEVGSH